jgi:hypothetical protein
MQLEKYPTTLGSFDFNFVVFTNVENFPQDNFPMTQICEGKKTLNHHDYFICQYKNSKID